MLSTEINVFIQVCRRKLWSFQIAINIQNGVFESNLKVSTGEAFLMPDRFQQKLPQFWLNENVQLYIILEWQPLLPYE
jgi:hypothetical protein